MMGAMTRLAIGKSWVRVATESNELREPDVTLLPAYYHLKGPRKPLFSHLPLIRPRAYI